MVAAAHRVHEVVGRVDVGGQRGQRFGAQQVALGRGHARVQGFGQCVGQGEAARVAHQAYHVVARGGQQRQQALADVARGAGEEDFHAAKGEKQNRQADARWARRSGGPRYMNGRAAGLFAALPQTAAPNRCATAATPGAHLHLWPYETRRTIARRRPAARRQRPGPNQAHHPAAEPDHPHPPEASPPPTST